MFILSIPESILQFISAFGVMQALLAAGLLYFHPKSDRSVTTYLALYIFCLSIPTLTPIVQYFFSWQSLAFTDPFPSLVGPLLYFYVRSFKEKITWRKAWPHCLVFLFFLAADYRFYTVMTEKYPLAKEFPKEVLQSAESYIPVGVRIIQMPIYYFLARKEWKSYQGSIRHLFSETSRIDLAWFRWLLNGYIILVGVMILAYLAMQEFPSRFSLILVINTALISPYLYVITYKGMTQPTLWQIRTGVNKEKVEAAMQQAEELNANGENGNDLSFQKTKQDDKTGDILPRIISLMETDKIYQEPELTLQQLADRIQRPSYQVSLAINEGMKKNFYDLINGYRVEEAKRLLLNPRNRNYTILSVGFEAGFNSKTTFNTVFKKFTGLTPSAFREQEKKSAVPA